MGNVPANKLEDLLGKVEALLCATEIAILQDYSKKIWRERGERTTRPVSPSNPAMQSTIMTL